LKTYRSPRELLARVESVLAAKPSSRCSPLGEVIELLCRGRHYTWMGIYLTVAEKTPQLLGASGDAQPGQQALPATRSKILVTMKLAGRELGVLDVESDRENAFGSEDRVLLENVATALARFLTGPGKYIARKARESAAQSTNPKPQARGPQAASVQPLRSAAVGEK
jgi:putative methionine-R-sulfoxide reductase with GAF domain